jgi:hypothetical protein
MTSDPGANLPPAVGDSLGKNIDPESLLDPHRKFGEVERVELQIVAQVRIGRQDFKARFRGFRYALL